MFEHKLFYNHCTEKVVSLRYTVPTVIAIYISPHHVY